MNDTIVAISTALGIGAISIVRLSGEKSIEVVNSIFKGNNLEECNTHTINYGHIIYKDRIIDEVLVSVMKAPNTFTREDVVEINCHGGITTTKKVLEVVLNNGVRLAEPGEFTKRAFLNGRIDLIEAESIMDLIEAKTEKARKLAINGVDGKISKQIEELRENLIEIISNIEVNIDYPEYEDILEYTNQMIKEKTKSIKQKLEKILLDSENGKIIKDGINVLILGKPNVGKSSVLNKLINEEKAIVTDIAGTTRDVVEGTVNIDGILLNIMDTAGIRTTIDKVEKIGVEKSLKLIEKAELVILVLSNEEKLSEEDIKIIKLTENKERIIFINKDDLTKNIDTTSLNDKDIVCGNTKEENGLNELIKKIKTVFNLEKIDSDDLTYLSNARQISSLKKALLKLNEIEEGIKKEMPIDILELDLKKMWELLGEIIGKSYSEELIDQLFCRFCLGK